MPSPFNYGWAALAVVCALIGAWAWGYHHGAGVTDQKWAAQRATEAYNAQTIERGKENAISNQFEQLQAQGAAAIDAARGELDSANAELGRLHQRLAAMRADADRADSSAAASCQATRKASMVYADLYERDSKRLGELGAAYEAARARGLTCEQAWDAMRQTYNLPAHRTRTR